MTIALAFLAGLVIGAAVIYFWNQTRINGGLYDVGQMRLELDSLREEINTFEAREDEICQQCIDDALADIQTQKVAGTPPVITLHEVPSGTSEISMRAALDVLRQRHESKR